MLVGNLNMAVGKNIQGGHITYAQIDIAAHEEWMMLNKTNPKASTLLHGLCHLSGPDEAVAASQATLAEYIGVSQMTISRALRVLLDQNWIEKIQLGRTSQTAAYRVNARAHWTGKRGSNSHMTSFRARILASEQEQPESIAGRPKLRKIPFIGENEEATYSGDGAEPPAQQGFPAVNPPSVDQNPDQADLEARGQQRMGFDNEDEQ